MTKLHASNDARVLLACMPWASTSQPSLALGLIKAQLAQVGIGADIAYLNILYADLVGKDTYDATKNRNVMASEWVFADGVTDAPAKEGYLDYLASRGASSTELALWERLRGATDEYIRACLNAVDWQRYEVVGLTTSMMQTVASLRLAKAIKSRYPHLKIVLGGANCEGQMGLTLHRLLPYVDVVVRGEVDDIVHELFRRLLAGEPVGELPGVCARDAGQVAVGATASLVEDLDRNPVPEYGDYFDQLAQFPQVERDTRVLLMFESSRGCWWGARSHCKFCALNGPGMRYRTKPVAKVVDEIATLRNRFGISTFAAVDNILDKASIDELCRELKERVPGVRVFYDIRAAVSREQMRKMTEGGIDEVEAGLENLSTPVLKRMGKGATGIHNVRFLRRCREFSISPLWNYLYGFPLESLDDYAPLVPKIAPFLHHLPAPDVAFPLSLQRYAPYHSKPAENGIEVTGPLDDYAYIYGFAPSDLEALAYYFKFRYLDEYDPHPTGILLTQVVTEWQAANAYAFLKAQVVDSECWVTDTRRGDERVHRLDPAMTQLYRLCESPRSAEQLSQDLLHLAPHLYVKIRGGISTALSRMEAMGLLYREDDKLLALAVPEDVDGFWLTAPPAATRRRELPILAS